MKEPGKTAQNQSYLSALRGGPQEHPLIYCEYDPSRSGEVPKRLLRGFEGFLQTDRYEGYAAIGREPKVVHVGCWAHARRKFDEALRGQRSKSRKSSKKTAKESVARKAMGQIQALYRIERKLNDASAEERHRVRQAESVPLVEALRAWLDDSIDRVPPQSLTGKAMAYLDRQWPKLVRVFADGRIPLDTKRVENAIRPFVVGRKNWLFADATAGSRASANLYGLVETAKANGIEPWAYLRHVFDALPRATLPDQVEALLPQSIDPALIRHPAAGRSSSSAYPTTSILEAQSGAGKRSTSLRSLTKGIGLRNGPAHLVYFLGDGRAEHPKSSFLHRCAKTSRWLLSSSDPSASRFV